MSEICHVFPIDFNSVKFASWRYRYVIPKRALDKMGFYSICDIKPKENTINIFHKHFIENSINWLEEQGGIFDVCDDHFKKKAGKYYIDMCKKATVVTCPTPKMAERISEETGVYAHVVPDPFDDIDFNEVKPEYKNTRTVCWFGHTGNLWTLDGLKVCCNGDLVSNFKSIYPKEKLTLCAGWNYIEWKLGMLDEVFKRHDIVVLFYGNSDRQHSKSPNRIMNSIRGGKIVVTNNTPVPYSYSLNDYVVISDDINEGIRWVWENSEKAIDKVRQGQEYIKENFSAERIAEKWLFAIKKLEGNNVNCRPN